MLSSVSRGLTATEDLSLVTGWLPAALTIAGGLALLTLWLFPLKARWWLTAALLILASAVIIFLADLFVTKIWRPFPDELPADVLLWSCLVVAAIVLTIAQLPRGGWWRRVGMLLVGVVAVAGLSSQINRFYGQYPTLGTALGLTTPKLEKLPDISTGATIAAPAGGYLSDVWHPSGTLPTAGTVSKIDITPVASGFRSRGTYIYVPPAYYMTPRPLLPVLVLLPGQPGNADSWLVSGQLTKMMDAYAQAHQGLAPIVVMPDNLGSNFANPLCTDSKLGKVETYLAKDVPAWVRAHLQTATDRTSWAIAGLSNGGTCALQMAVREPSVYGRFIDMSGEYEPLIGTRQQTIDKIFDGDAAAYSRINPVEIMAQQKFPDTDGLLVSGTGDATYLPQQKRIFEACKAAGMDMSWLELPGGHTWQVWRPGLELSLPWLAEHTGLVRP